MLNHPLAVRCCCDGARVTLEQRTTQQFFGLLDLHGNRGWRAEDDFGGRREITGISNRDQSFEGVELCSEQDRSAFDVHQDRAITVKGRSVSPLVWVSAFGYRFLQWIERRREQRESRDVFAHLLKLDDSLLLDIGVTRADVERAARLPLAEDAAQVLYESTGR